MASGPCLPTFERLAGQLGGFSCDGAAPVVDLRDPSGLTNWTLPVIEAVMVAGALLALRHAVVRLRRHGDPAGLALWAAAVVYLAIIEPPLYFPDRFGLEDQVGLIFVHNVFSVQFLFDRLPLYIVAVYPAMAYLAYEVVRSLGVFDRRGPVVAAAAVGFVHQCFYEIFDHLGPQLAWWAWNPGAETNEPALAAVPLSSMVIFGTVGPFALTLLVRLLVARRVARSGPLPPAALGGRIVVVAVLMPLLLVLGGIPNSLFALGDEPHRAGQAVAMSLELGLLAAVGAWALIDAWRHRRRGPALGPPEPGDGRHYVLVHGILYLVTLAVLWVSALPAHLDARDGVTADGTPTGSLLYVLACVAAAVAVLVGGRDAFWGRA